MLRLRRVGDVTNGRGIPPFAALSSGDRVLIQLIGNRGPGGAVLSLVDDSPHDVGGQSGGSAQSGGEVVGW